MTSLNFLFEPQRVCLSTDTLVVLPDSKEPLKFTTKVFPVPHLKGVICGTGALQLLMEWFVLVQTSVVCRDISHLDQFAPQLLSQLARKPEYAGAGSSTVYHFGYDEAASRFRGFAYRSKSSFSSDELKYGIGSKPPTNVERFESLPEAFIELTKHQRSQDQAKPLAEQVGIGGEILFLLMEPDYMALQICHRFEDYNECYRLALKHVTEVIRPQSR